MSTQSSLIRAALLASAFALAGVAVLGCADEEEAGNLVGPDATLTHASAGDLHADSSTTVDTAYVAPGHVEELVGAVVNADGSITKGGIDIGNLAAPGPIGPTGTTGVPGTGSGSGGPGSESGGGAVPDKEAPISNPTGPQFEVWCMVRIVYSLDTGLIYSVTILYCWDDGSGGGGGGGGNNNNQNQQQVSFSLSCDVSVTRGQKGKCKASVTDGDGNPVVSRDYTFSWSSTSGARKSGKGADEWEGVATGDVTVTLSVGRQFSDSQDINVRPRSNWRTNEFSAAPSYSRALPDRIFGDHEINRTTPSIPSPQAGSGPWDGQYTAGKPPTVRNRIRIQANYTAAGPTHPGANGPCPSISFNSNYYRINTVCGSWPNALSWRDDVLLHERDHESEYNKCLRASSSVMDQMEGVVESSRSAASQAMMDIWRPFYQNKLRALSPTYARRIATGSNVFWHYNSGWSGVAPL